MLDQVHEQLGAVRRRAVGEPRPRGLLLLAVLLDARRRRRVWSEAVDGADPAFMNFLEALIERHRMPAIFRIRDRYEEMWEDEHNLLPGRA